MRVLRRRAAAMSPREKRLLLLSVLGLLTLTLYFVSSFLYAALILAVFCVVYFYHSGETLPARLGPNPRAGVIVPAALRRWFRGLGVTGVSVSAKGKTKSGVSNRTELRESEGHLRNRVVETSIYRRDVLPSNSFLFSPRDLLMGSYIGKAEGPTAEFGRPRAGRNIPEQLRERLSRPNHAVHTPVRRLSFAGEPLGTAGRFTITPQRHYPLQQPGASSVGVLPPVKWDGFRKKNILTPRNSPVGLSPVTVKIARPDHNSPSIDHLSCSGLSRAPADPCSRESVLKVLRESRKREVEDEDKSSTAEQRSKRRRNDSGGSAHSAFEPLLPNGNPSQLVPKPGSLKRGMTSLSEESIMKRSRTSSISSGSGALAPRGTPGTRRNAIQSSYSSSLGLTQWKKRSAPSSPLSSPGSSRCQTPEGVAKRPREDEGQSPSSASSVRSDHTATEKVPVTSKAAEVPSVPVATSTSSAGSGGKRKRKILSVSSHRDDQISLPPPPELGYTVAVKDLNEEAKAGLSKIQKVLETPAPEQPEKSVSPPASTSTQPPSSASATLAAATTSSTTSSSSTTLMSLLTAPLPKASTSPIPVINLDPSPGNSALSSSSSSSISAPAATTNPLLEALKMKINIPASSTPAASTTTTAPASIAPAVPSNQMLNPATTVNAPQLPSAAPPSSSAGAETPSPFAQVQAQTNKTASGTPAVTGTGLFGLGAPMSSSSTSNPLNTLPSLSSSSTSSTNPLLASGFKPIFPVSTASSTSATTSASTPVAPHFKPIFSEATAASGFGQPSALTTTNLTSTVSSTPSMFAAPTSSSTAAPPAYPGLTTTLADTTSISTAQPAAPQPVKTLFGNWSTPSTTSTSAAPVKPPTTGATFQFGAAPATTSVASVAPAAAAPAAATTSSSQAAFTFGAKAPEQPAATQNVFTFGQATPTANTTTASFGGFAMASAASTTAATTTQSTFAFGKTPFEAPAPSSTFGTPVAATTAAAAAPPNPFTFGGSATSTTPANNPAPAPAPFTFGAPAATTAATFGNPAKPTFGASSTGFAFGSTTAAASAPPSFGAATQAQSASSSTFSFGGAAPQPTSSAPAQPASGGFNFGGGMPVPQFGTPVSSNPAPQMGSFNFGAAATDKPAFGTSTPSFGQAPAVGPIPFGSPGTPVQGFNAVPFGSPATPSFSIGAGSKPSGARQRLQARRQHNRKK